MSTPSQETKQLINFPSTGSVSDTDLFYSAVSTTLGAEQATTAKQLKTYIQAPFANSTLASAGTLSGAETVPLGISGLFQASLSKIATWIVSAFQGFTQSGTGAVARSVTSKLSGIVHADDFGPFNNGTGDDAVAIQAAINYIQSVGGGTVSFTGTKTYYLKTPLTMDPILVSLQGNGCIIDGKNMTLTNPASVTELCADPTFSNASAWLAGTLTPRGTEFTIGSGQATRTVGSSLYADFGMQIAGIQANKTYQVTIVISAIASSGTQKYLTLGIRSGVGSPAGNGIGYGDGTSVTETLAGTYSFTITAPADTPAAGGWLCIGTNNTVTLTSISVKLVPTNYMLLVRATSTQYGQGRNSISNFRFQNSSGASIPYQDGIYFDTSISAYSSRMAVFNVELRTGLNRPLVLANRAYLIHFYNCNAVGYSCAVQFLTNSQDAGENISFHGATFGASNGPCILNGGAELYFHSCSFDYSPQFYVGQGTFNGQSCHFEMSLNGAAATQYPFDNQGGDVVLDGGYILIAGDNFTSGATQNYMFNTATFQSRFFLKNVSGYNWRTATGQLAGGPGRVVIEGLLGGANHQIPGIIMRNSHHNIFGSDGSFETGVITQDLWIAGGDQTQTSRYLAQWGASGASGSASVAISTDYARTGTYSLKITKTTVGAGTALKFYMLAPIRRNGLVGNEFWWLAPANLGTGTFAMYVQSWFVQTQGRNSIGIPTFLNKEFYSEPDQTVSLAGSSTWTQVSSTTTFADGSVTQDGFAPAWADAMYFIIDLSNAPAGFVLYLDDIYGSAF